MTTRPAQIHFWSPTGSPLGIDSWRPDDEPERFADGRGHALFELFARARAAGRDASLGATVPDGTALVVVFAKDLGAKASLRLIARAAHLPTVVILGDWNPGLRLPVRGTVVVRHHGRSARTPREVVLPLLPQRGLKPRSPDRFGHVATIGFQGDPRQAPAFWSDRAFERTLRSLRVDVVRSSDARRTWHDFSALDAVLCMRARHLRASHKPPTKLVNAWTAGSIPIVGPEPAYRELVTDGSDGLLVSDERSVVAAVERLVTDPATVARLESGVLRRRVEYSPESVLGRWLAVLDEAAVVEARTRGPALGYALGRWVRAQASNHRPGGGIARM